MKLFRFTVPVITLLFISCSGTGQESEILLYDDFSSADSYWYWRIDGQASHTQTGTGFIFEVDESANAGEYSNSEIYESGANVPWYRNRAFIRIANPAVQVGSRGWGFWNGSMDPAQSVMAWFMYAEGDDNFIGDGFYACTQVCGEAPVMTLIDTIDLSSWHDYEIDWRSDQVRYYADSELLATHNISPDRYTQLHVWVDNGNWDVDWNRIAKDPPADSTLELDSITVYDR